MFFTQFGMWPYLFFLEYCLFELYLLHLHPSHSKNYPSVAWNSITAADANELVRIQKVIAYLTYGPYGHAIPIQKLNEIECVF